MKRLIQTLFVMAVITGIGFIISLLLTNEYDSKVAIAGDSGYTDGRTQGVQVGAQEGSEAGYQDGSKVGYARSRQESAVGSYRTDFYFVYNPTYDEVLALLLEQENSSAIEIHDYAEAHGLRSAYVRVEINRQAEEGKIWVYRLVAFDTVDRRLIVIEPSTQKIVQLELGRGFREQNNFSVTPGGDMITRVTYIW